MTGTAKREWVLGRGNFGHIGSVGFQGLRRYLDIMMSPSFSVRVLACAAGAALYFSAEWRWLRAVTLTTLAGTFRLWGMPVVLVEEHHLMIVDFYPIRIGPDCTYVDWFLCAAPFFWKGVGPLRDVGRILAMAAVVFGVNLVRIHFAVVAHLAGLPWWWSHDLVDYAVWYPSLVVVVAVWIRSRAREPVAQESP